MLDRLVKGLLVALVTGGLILSAQAKEHPLQKRILPDAPEVYDVQPGDTLWGIAARFLEDPWMWPILWQENPQLEHPARIYPGDQLRLLYTDDGVPRVEKDPDRVVHVSPDVRISRYHQAVPAIPLKQIRPFIERHQVFSRQQIKDSGYILGAEDSRIITGVGDLVYVRKVRAAADGTRFLVYREQKDYRDKAQILGTELKYIGTLEQIAREQGVAIMRIVQAKEEVRADDLVTLSDQGDTPATFFPSPPSRRVRGSIISVLGGVRFGGTHTVVAIDLGKRHRLVPGNVLTIRQQRASVKDVRSGDKTVLPPEVTGQLMVFRTFDRVSYALVMEARKPISVGDQLITPTDLR